MKKNVTFTVDIKGKETEETFKGEFEARTKLSLKDTLRQDEIRRTILGTNGAEASAEAYNIAFMAAYCAVRITKAPDWWTASDNGTNLEDLNVLDVVSTKCADAINEALGKVVKEAESAQKELKKIATE
jgi:hypothetical protein